MQSNTNKRKRRFKSGGTLVDDKKAMVLSQIKEVHHHADELAKVLANMNTVDAWVVGKMERATTDLSDITHYLDGTTEYADGGMMAKGGKTKDFKVGDKVVYAHNGKFFVRNRENFKHGEITKIEEVGALKIKNYTIERRNNFGQLMETYTTTNLKEIELDDSNMAEGGMMAKGGNVKAKKYQVLSPDGITIEREVPYYTSKNKAMNAFNEWKQRYSLQGYYSSARYGRIDLLDLEDYCQFITL